MPAAIRRATQLALAAIAAPLLLIAAVLPRRRRRLLLWGPEPLLNYRYWSAALTQGGWDSLTLVSSGRPFTRRDDFDRFYDDLVRTRSTTLANALGPYAAFLFILRRAAVLHTSFDGGPLGVTPLWRIEARLLRLAGVRTVLIPYGGDVFVASRMTDRVAREALLESYPSLGQREARIAEQVDRWCRDADVIVMGFSTDMVPRWDVPVGNMLCIDVERWQPARTSTDANGRNGRVRVLHSSSHRPLKGTELFIDAVERLRDEGLDVELIVAENEPNERIRELLAEADILADQLIVPGYGLAAVEGMASGLPVMSNVNADPAMTKLFRDRSFLTECPIVATTPQSVVDELRKLVTDPGHRAELGRAGREYVERFHSYAFARGLFEPIYRKLLDGEEVNLAELPINLRRG